MNSKTKMTLSITAMVLLTLIAITSIIAIFAANQQGFVSNIKVTYRADQIEGSVSAKYYVGPTDEDGTDMKSENGETKLEFHAKDTTMTGKSLNPEGEIVLEYPDEPTSTPDKSWVVFEYCFKNGLGTPISTAYMATMSFAGKADNLVVTTKDNETQITDYTQITDEVTDPTNFTVSASVPNKAENDYIGVRYVYIKAEIDNPGADSELNGNFNWSLGVDKATYEKLQFDNKGEYFEVSANESASGEVVIPATYQGIPVKLAAGYYYYDWEVEVTDCNSSYANKPITKLEIGNGITDIPNAAFCNALFSEIVIPNSIKSICNTEGGYGISYEVYSFYGCNIKKIVYSGTIKQWCELDGVDGLMRSFNPSDSEQGELYINNEKVEGKLIIPENVTKINDYAFYKIDDITSVEIGSGVQSIGNYAFEHCSGLTGDLVIPSGVTSIGTYAFGYIDITNIEIPNSVEYVGEYAFRGCNSLQYYTSENGKYLGNLANNYVILMGVVDEEQTTLEINSNCKIIYSFAWPDGSGLKNLVMGPNVKFIGIQNSKIGFQINYTGTLKQWCEESITGLDNIMKSGFELYISDQKIAGTLKITDDITKINDYAFRFIDDITSVEIGSGVQSIGNYAFYDCSGLTSVEIGSGVQSIGNYAFHYCYGLNEVIIDSQTIYSALSSGSSNIGNLTDYLQSGTGTVKVLEDIDDGSNEYLKTSFTKSDVQEEINGKKYNVYTKN